MPGLAALVGLFATVAADLPAATPEWLCQDPQGPGQEAPAPPPARKHSFVRGQLLSRYLLRWTADDTDQDLVETLSVDVGDADHDAVTAHFMGRLAWDVDGYDPTFASINDSYGSRADFLAYDAYADLLRLPGLAFARVGRQSVYETPEVAYFDGLRLESETTGAIEFQAGAYVGASTHLYESSHAGDLTTGCYVQARPWQGGRVRLDYMHLEDRALLGSNKDDLLGAGVWQQFGQFRLEGQYSHLEGHARDARGRLFFADPDADVIAQASYYGLLTAQGDLVLEADPFFNSLQQLFPYDQFGALVSKGFWERLRLQAATDLRRVRNATDIGVYNRDYDRYYGTATLLDLGTEDLSLSGTFDIWNSNGQIVRSWGGELAYDHDAVALSVGTYYSLYKFDLFSNAERDHVRTWFGRARYKASQDWTFELRYELEDDDLDQYHRLQMGVTWRF